MHDQKIIDQKGFYYLAIAADSWFGNGILPLNPSRPFGYGTGSRRGGQFRFLLLRLSLRVPGPALHFPGNPGRGMLSPILSFGRCPQLARPYLGVLVRPPLGVLARPSLWAWAEGGPVNLVPVSTFTPYRITSRFRHRNSRPSCSIISSICSGRPYHSIDCRSWPSRCNRKMRASASAARSAKRGRLIR